MLLVLRKLHFIPDVRRIAFTLFLISAEEPDILPMFLFASLDVCGFPFFKLADNLFTRFSGKDGMGIRLDLLDICLFEIVITDMLKGVQICVNLCFLVVSGVDEDRIGIIWVLYDLFIYAEFKVMRIDVNVI